MRLSSFVHLSCSWEQSSVRTVPCCRDPLRLLRHRPDVSRSTVCLSLSPSVCVFSLSLSSPLLQCSSRGSWPSLQDSSVIWTSSGSLPYFFHHHSWQQCQTMPSPALACPHETRVISLVVIFGGCHALFCVHMTQLNSCQEPTTYKEAGKT